MTQAQLDKIALLGGDPKDFHPTYDLPQGWVAGWAGTVYYGIDPSGRASS